MRPTRTPGVDSAHPAGPGSRAPRRRCAFQQWVSAEAPWAAAARHCASGRVAVADADHHPRGAQSAHRRPHPGHLGRQGHHGDGARGEQTAQHPVVPARRLGAGEEGRGVVGPCPPGREEGALEVGAGEAGARVVGAHAVEHRQRLGVAVGAHRQQGRRGPHDPGTGQRRRRTAEAPRIGITEVHPAEAVHLPVHEPGHGEAPAPGRAGQADGLHHAVGDGHVPGHRGAVHQRRGHPQAAAGHHRAVTTGWSPSAGHPGPAAAARAASPRCAEVHEHGNTATTAASTSPTSAVTRGHPRPAIVVATSSASPSERAGSGSKQATSSPSHPSRAGAPQPACVVAGDEPAPGDPHADHGPNLPRRRGRRTVGATLRAR